MRVVRGFLGDDETEPFGKDRHLYDLKALARFLCVRSFKGGREDGLFRRI